MEKNLLLEGSKFFYFESSCCKKGLASQDTNSLQLEYDYCHAVLRPFQQIQSYRAKGSELMQGCDGCDCV